MGKMSYSSAQRKMENSFTEKYNSFTKKNQADFGYFCPKCHRIYDITTDVKACVFPHGPSSIQYPEEPTYKPPVVNIVASEGVNVICPCGNQMIPVDPCLASISMDFRRNFGYENITMNSPIAITGSSYAAGEIEFHDSCDLDRMRWLIDGLITMANISQFECAGSQYIKSYAVNDKSRAVTVEIKERNLEIETLLEIPGTYIRIKEIYDTDVSINNYKSHLYNYLGRLIKEIYSIQKNTENKE